MRRRRSHERRQRPGLPLVFLLFAAVSAGGAAHALGPNDRRMTSLRAGITVEAPAGWTLSQHTGYRETVVLMLHPDGSRISVTAAPTQARDAASLLEQNKRGLAAQGLVLSRSTPGERGSVKVDLVAPGRDEAIRQIYLVRTIPRGHQAVVLTLVCPTPRLAAHGPALDFSVARLLLENPVGGSTAGRNDGRAPGAGGSGGDLRRSELNRNTAPQQIEER